MSWISGPMLLPSHDHTKLDGRGLVAVDTRELLLLASTEVGYRGTRVAAVPDPERHLRVVRGQR